MRTVGVEEELLLVDAIHGRPTAIGHAVVSTSELLASVGLADHSQIEHEFKQEQAEIASSPCTSLDQLRDELVERRAKLANVARMRGGLAVAIATSPVKVRPHQTDGDRYVRMNDEFGLLARQQLTCGQHVHVSVESREEGVAVVDRIRIWLPLLIALSSNSPFWQGADTGYASYRTVLWSLWPSAGPTELFRDVAGYDRRVNELVATGAALDEAMVYFAARLSARYPTVEIRVADVCTNVDDAVLIAALCRALVETAAGEWRNGIGADEVPSVVLAAAGWRAARHGVRGQLYDPHRAERTDAWRLIDEMIEHVAPALAQSGDERLVNRALERLRRDGTGADLQRRSAAGGRPTAGLSAVVLDAAERTVDAAPPA